MTQPWRPITLLLFVPMTIYLIVVMVWHAQGTNPITGDEPHYLLVADSLLRDGDLAVLNNYRIDTPVARELPGSAAPADTHTQNGHSIHGVGLPLLLLPAYALGGVLGAKLWLALLVGLTPLAVYHAARAIVPGTGWPVAIAVLIGLGQPFVSAAGQIYPDLIAGLIMFWLLGAMADPHPPARSPSRGLGGAGQRWIDGLLLASLPWLHIKFLLPAVIICLAYAQSGVSHGSTQPDSLATKRRRGAAILSKNAPTAVITDSLATKRRRGEALRVASSPHRLVASSQNCKAECAHFETCLMQRNRHFTPTILSISLISLGLYNWRAFGAILGPYQPGDATVLPTQIGMIFLGLHIDRMQGLFVQAPLLLLGVFGLAFFIAEQRRLAIITGLVYLAVMLPHAAHTNWYGGTSFAGRFFWSTALLWCFPLLYAVRHLQTCARLRLRLGLLMAVPVQVIFLAKVLIPNSYTYNSTVRGAASWLESNPYSDFFDLPASQRAQFLPSFRDVDSYLQSPTNWVYISLLGCVAGAGYCALRRRVR
ncbi:MAG: hypothetical protein WCF99_16480 [Chloroflexales bacterium]